METEVVSRPVENIEPACGQTVRTLMDLRLPASPWAKLLSLGLRRQAVVRAEVEGELEFTMPLTRKFSVAALSSPRWRPVGSQAEMRAVPESAQTRCSESGKPMGLHFPVGPDRRFEFVKKVHRNSR